ncbi:MAG TPA: hypothetical protein VLS89_14500 [Candidatus Nanopelagicales bacterium]|nr:hypothetical protein [Candidatus Nanopelagicales bacterium]
MKQAWLGLAFVLAALAGGCGSDVEENTGGGGGGDGGGGGGGGGGGLPDGVCSVAEPCTGGDICVFSQGSCAPEATGICESAFSCDGPSSGPLCGCDGVVVEGEYAECTQWENSEPYADPELCATGTFACGSLSCVRHVELCLETLPGVPGDPSYECIPLSQVQGTCSHGIADCTCVDLSMMGGASCSSDADHQETITVALP